MEQNTVRLISAGAVKEMVVEGDEMELSNLLALNDVPFNAEAEYRCASQLLNKTSKIQAGQRILVSVPVDSG